MIFSTAEWEEEPGALSARRGNCAVSRFTAHGLLAHSTARVPWLETHLVMCEYIFSFGGARRRGVSSCSHVCGGVATRSLAVSQNAPRHWGWRGKKLWLPPSRNVPCASRRDRPVSLHYADVVGGCHDDGAAVHAVLVPLCGVSLSIWRLLVRIAVWLQRFCGSSVGPAEYQSFCSLCPTVFVA